MGEEAPLLEVDGLTASYGRIQALQPVALKVLKGEVVVVLGPNGAGKSTLLRAVMGLVDRSGDIRFDGRPVASWPTRRLAESGVVMVPEGRGILGPLTVRDNLDLGAYTRRHKAKGEVAADLDAVFTLFPRLRERQAQLAGSLSGGEQQMLAVGRAMMARPVLLMLDEPSLGLAPRVADEIFRALETLKRGGLTLLVVEQKAPLALRIADRAYVLRSGRIVAGMAASELGSQAALAKLYLGA